MHESHSEGASKPVSRRLWRIRPSHSLVVNVLILALGLSASDSKISLQGLLLAGMVIGALGVLIDLTVSQASTVIALRRVDARLGFRQLFGGALEVVMITSPPLSTRLSLPTRAPRCRSYSSSRSAAPPFTDAVNSEAVSEEVIAALIGSIGLIASMPITTALASLLAPRMSDRQLRADHAHAH